MTNDSARQSPCRFADRLSDEAGVDIDHRFYFGQLRNPVAVKEGDFMSRQALAIRYKSEKHSSGSE